MKFLTLFLPITGFIIAIGAATVIDTIGFLGRKSRYWTSVAIKAHHVTKPLIWVGTGVIVVGLLLLYSTDYTHWYAVAHAILFLIIILNGVYLHFVVSKELSRREKFWLDQRLLPKSLQKKIVVGMVISFVSWWSSLVIFILYLTEQYG